jgi:hypothetical protein
MCVVHCVGERGEGKTFLSSPLHGEEEERGERREEREQKERGEGERRG